MRLKRKSKRKDISGEALKGGRKTCKGDKNLQEFITHTGFNSLVQ